VNKKVEFVINFSKSLEESGRGVGLFADMDPTQIIEEFEDMSLYEISLEVYAVEQRCLHLIQTQFTEDMINQRNEDRKNKR
jgi:hypothetical protein